MNQQKVVRRVTVCLLFVFALGSTQRSLANPNFCSICNHPIRDVAYLVRDRMEGEQKHICEECSLLNRRCFLCGLPIRENYQQLPDGRFLCARDAKVAVLDVVQAKQACREAKLEIDRLFSRFLQFPETNVILSIEDQIHMEQLAQTPGFERQCPSLVGYTRSRLVRDGRWKHSIGILSGLPQSQLMSICAHEYSHTWIKENVPLDREMDQDAIEGFCELIGWKLMEKMDQTREMEFIKQNTYSRGQIDLFIEAEKTYGLYTVLQWLKFGMDERLNEEDLDRIRKVDWKRAQPAAARATAPEPPPTVGPTPVPDTLTLVGISGSGSRRLALINDRAFAANESGRVRVARTNASVHCLEIRSNSVLIELEGAPEKQELFLKSK